LLDNFNVFENLPNKEVYIEKLCAQFKLIIFCDTIRIGRPFYSAKLYRNKCNETRFALQIVDRIDRWMKKQDVPKFIQEMKNFSQDSNIFWLPNNNFEIYYLNKNGIYPRQDNLFLIRPYGVLDNSDKYNKIKQTNNTIVYLHSELSISSKFMANFKGLNKKDYKIFTHGVYGELELECLNFK